MLYDVYNVHEDPVVGGRNPQLKRLTSNTGYFTLINYIQFIVNNTFDRLTF